MKKYYLLFLSALFLVIFFFVGYFILNYKKIPFCIVDENCQSNLCWTGGMPFTKCQSKLNKTQNSKCDSRYESINSSRTNLKERFNSINDKYGELLVEPRKCKCSFFKCDH